MSSRLARRMSARSDSPTPPSPYTGAVSMKLMPASSAAWSRPCLSSTTPHQSLASVHTPNPTSDTSRSLRPNRRYRTVTPFAMWRSRSARNLLPGTRRLPTGTPGAGLAILALRGAQAVAQDDRHREHDAGADQRDHGHAHE